MPQCDSRPNCVRRNENHADGDTHQCFESSNISRLRYKWIIRQRCPGHRCVEGPQTLWQRHCVNKNNKKMIQEMVFVPSRFLCLWVVICLLVLFCSSSFTLLSFLNLFIFLCGFSSIFICISFFHFVFLCVSLEWNCNIWFWMKK